MAAFMATTTKHSAQLACITTTTTTMQPATMHAKSGGGTPTLASNLAYGTPRPPQTGAGASGGGWGALVPGLCLLHRTLQDRAN